MESNLMHLRRYVVEEVEPRLAWTVALHEPSRLLFVAYGLEASDFRGKDARQVVLGALALHHSGARVILCPSSAPQVPPGLPGQYDRALRAWHGQVAAPDQFERDISMMRQLATVEQGPAR